jgi:predicted metal-binding protein
VFGLKSNPQGGTVELTPAESPVTEALILICEKCGKKLAAEGEENPSQQLKAVLKEKIRSVDKKGQWRAVVSSCMDVCPKDEITIAIAWADGQRGGNQFLTLRGKNADHASEAILAYVEKHRR